MVSQSLNDQYEKKYIDCHCHLQDYSKEELSNIIMTCLDRGIIALFTNSTSQTDFEDTLTIASETYNNDKEMTMKIIPGFGYHPWHLAHAIENTSDWFEEFIAFLNKIPPTMKYFIGEIGIDGGKVKKTFPLDQQIPIFTKQLELANERNLLVHIHCVYEWDKLYKIMKGMNLDTLIKNNKLLLHSFQGKSKHIDKFNTINVWYSISSGCFSESNIEMLKKIPNEKLLLESDSPSMFNPNIFPNKESYTNTNTFILLDKDKNTYKNSPISIIYLTEKLAEIKGITKKELTAITLKNSQSLLNNEL